MKNSKNQNTATLIVVSIIAMIGALGYGIIIPLMYSYVERLGVNAFWLGVLFASYSLAQFISTPIIGRLSDRFGRKGLMAYSVFGSAVSFFLFAIANSMPILFLARILDGISGGNISVAQAVISDTTEPKERAKWFGVLGAAFGFGFVFGPAIGGFLSTVSLQAPFYFAAFLSLIATLLVIFVQKETLKEKDRENKPLTNLFDIKSLYNALFEPYVGLALIASFISAFAFSVWVLGFQTFTNDILKLSPTNISWLFVVFGIVGLIMQGYGVGALVKKIQDVKLLIFGTVVVLLSFVAMGLTSTFNTFLIACIFLAIGNSFLAPIITTLLSKHAKKADQGGIMGINQAYLSLANVAGPVIGGALATRSVHYAFWGAALTIVLMLFVTFIMMHEHGKHVVDL